MKLLAVLSLAVLALAILSGLGRRSRRRAPAPGSPAPRRTRLLQPRTPADCTACRTTQACSGAVPRDPPPWNTVKSRRGRPKRLPTEGYACPRPTCAYFGITAAHLHALVGDGRHGLRERIQTFRCQACGATLSARRETPLYQLKTPTRRVGEVLTALAEGLDVAAATRVFGHDHATITRWLTRAGAHSARWHEQWLRHLHLPHLQLDELCTRVRRPAGALCVALRALGLSGRITTAFVERVNLTLRRGVPALARRTWATAQSPALLLAQVQWWRAYYHCCRLHAALRLTATSGTVGRTRQRTPAMAAGLATRCWPVADLLCLPVPRAIPKAG